eukprot:TRINITY_DN635_c0_g1_i3.p1 TRINITY_DN635_c0_g1~~TRINITY_DN635_c0_g1_i3.p1  ORF type:complete len:450 (-),score=118.71 TRINITY_DN635_c0_g1_i3:42-1391(-)
MILITASLSFTSPPSATTDTAARGNSQAQSRKLDIIEILRHQYSSSCGRLMKRYAVPEKSLKKYTATRKDVGSKVVKMPKDEFMVVDLMPAKKSAELSSSVETSPSPAKADFIAKQMEVDKTEAETVYPKVGPNNKVTLKDFGIISIIGKGGFGTVYLVEKLDEKTLFAMKQLRKDLIIKNRSFVCTQIEGEILQLANHPFLVGMAYVFSSTTSIFFVMKFYRGGELYRHLKAKKRFEEDAVRFYVAQIVLALGELHKNNVIYRDMKPENILLDVDGYVALTDFGLSKFLDENQVTSTFCGTPDYIAPELVNGLGYNKQVDWWGVGILIYELLFGCAPFRSKNQHMMYRKITLSEVPFPDPGQAEASEDAKDIIRKLLCKNPRKRLGASKDAEEVLSHSFFSKINIEKLLNKELEAPFKPPVDESNKYDLQNFKTVSYTHLTLPTIYSV